MMLFKGNDEKDEKEDRHVLMICYIPESLKRRFKMYCAENGVSMSGTVVKIIRKILEKYEARKG